MSKYANIICMDNGHKHITPTTIILYIVHTISLHRAATDMKNPLLPLSVVFTI